jgi:hypothetical protein
VHDWFLSIISFFLYIYGLFRALKVHRRFYYASPHLSVLRQLFSLIISSSLRSSLTRSVHRCLGLPIGRFLFGFHIVTSCTVWPSALQTCPAQLIRLLLRIPTMFGLLNIALSSALVLRSYKFSSFLLGP